MTKNEEKVALRPEHAGPEEFSTYWQKATEAQLKEMEEALEEGKLEQIKKLMKKVLKQEKKIAQYLNVSPTKLKRMIEVEKDPEEKKKMEKAYKAWIDIYKYGPTFRRNIASKKRLIKRVANRFLKVSWRKKAQPT